MVAFIICLFYMLLVYRWWVIRVFYFFVRMCCFRVYMLLFLRMFLRC